MPEVDGVPGSTPAAETPSAPEPTKVDDEVSVETEEAVAEAPVEEYEEIDWDDGQKYKVPKALKDGFLRQKDYTQKTQTVAEQRKQLEATAQQMVQRDQVARQHVQEIGTLMQMDQRLAQFTRVDWQKLELDDPFKAQSLVREYTMLRDQRNNLANQVQTREQQRAAESQRNFATAYQRTNEQLARDIPGWNQELANNLAGLAREIGLTDKQIEQWAISVPAVKMLHKAYLGNQLSQARQTAVQTAEPKVEPRPLSKVSGSGAKPSVNMENADMETFSRELHKQMAARRR